jgi:hypothetical protein
MLQHLQNLYEHAQVIHSATLTVLQSGGLNEQQTADLHEMHNGAAWALHTLQNVDPNDLQATVHWVNFELRSALQNMIGFGDLLLMGVNGDLHPQQQEYLQYAYQHSLAMVQTIDEMAQSA